MGTQVLIFLLHSRDILIWDMKINYNSVYVINQPKSTIMSIILVSDEMLDCPLPEEIHEKLHTLSGCSDQVFLFSSGSERKIDCRKFTNLYQGSSFLVGDWKHSIPEILKYSSEIFKMHLTTLIFDLSWTGNIDTDSLVRINASAINGPVFKIRQKTAEELFDYYKYVREDKVNRRWEFWKQPSFSPTNTDNNFYSIWSTESKVILIRYKMLGRYIEMCGIIDTFDSYQDFFATATKMLGIEHMDIEVSEINL